MDVRKVQSSLYRSPSAYIAHSQGDHLQQRLLFSFVLWLTKPDWQRTIRSVKQCSWKKMYAQRNRFSPYYCTWLTSENLWRLGTSQCSYIDEPDAITFFRQSSRTEHETVIMDIRLLVCKQLLGMSTSTGDKARTNDIITFFALVMKRTWTRLSLPAKYTVIQYGLSGVLDNKQLWSLIFEAIVRGHDIVVSNAYRKS